MAIDLYNPNKSGYNTKCKLFKTEHSAHKITDLRGYKLFYSKDLGGFKTTVTSNGHFRDKSTQGVIETNDMIDFEIDDTVEIYGVRYRIDSIEIEDNEQQKGLSKRIKKLTRLVLVC